MLIGAERCRRVTQVGAHPHPLDVHFLPSSVGFCVFIACPVIKPGAVVACTEPAVVPIVIACPVIEPAVVPIVIACPVIEPAVDPGLWVVVGTIKMHSFNEMVVFTC